MRKVKPSVAALLVTMLLFSSILVATQAYGQAVTLSATVAQSFSFTTTGSGSFGTVTPLTPDYSTTTLAVTTNDTNGWNVSLSGGWKTTANMNMQMTGATSTQITDQTEWIPGTSTSTAGNSVVQASLINSSDVLAFRVSTASSTNGAAFYSTTWWGASDAGGVAKWAGIASSTVLRKIGDAGGGSPGTYSASTHYNDVVYYLNVAASQPTGAYTTPLTFSATGD